MEGNNFVLTGIIDLSCSGTDISFLGNLMYEFDIPPRVYHINIETTKCSLEIHSWFGIGDASIFFLLQQIYVSIFMPS